MAGSRGSTPKRKAKQSENYIKARATEEARRKASKGQNVAPGTFNGKTVGGFTPARILAREIIRSERAA